jgi:hypothetical protein
MRARRALLVCLAAAAIAAGAGCAARRPLLYPNQAWNQAGAVGAEQDIDECLALARAHGLDAHPEHRTAASTAAGGAMGGAVGAATGAVWGHPGRGAGAGAAGGATAGLLRGMFRWRDPDPLQARFVDICLSQQGYQVVGWR